MSYDGTVKIGTLVDESGLKKGLSGLGSLAKTGFSAMASAAKAATAAVGAAATGVAAVGKYAIDVGSDFEAGMSKVSAISGAVGEDLDALTAKAKEMGAKTKFSATESSEAMQYMAMAGWETADMLDGIAGIMNLAAADGLDLATTSDIVTDALTAFNLSAADSGHFADVLAKASSSANTNVSMMGETFKYVAPVAGALGYSIEDTAVAIGLMANSGIKGSQAGTSLRQMMSRLAKPTDEVYSAMESLGISMTDSQGNMKSLAELMVDLRKSFSGLSQAEQAQYASSIAGQEAMSGLLAIVNASDKDFQALTEQINNADGAAAQMAETMQDNLQGQMTLLKSAAEGLGVSLYEGMQNPLKELAKVGQESLNELLVAFNDGGINGMIQAGASILTNLITGAAEKLPDLITLASSAIDTFAESLKSSSLGDAGISLLTSLGAAIVQNAGTLVSTAIVLVGQMAQGIADNAPQLIQAVADSIYSVIESAAEWLPDIVSAGEQILGALVEGVNNAPAILELGADIIDDLIGGFLEKAPEVFSTGAELLNELAVGIANEIPSLLSKAIDIIIRLAEALTEPNTLSNILNAAISIIEGLAKGILDAIPKLLKVAPKILANLAVALISNIPRLAEAAINIVASIGKYMINNAQALIKAIPDLFVKLVEGFKSMDWGQIGKNLISGIKNGLLDAASSLISSAKDIAKQAFDAVKDFFGIHSPSRLMRDVIGKNIIAGMEVGMDDETPNLEKKSLETASAAVDSMKTESSDMVAAMRSRAYKVTDTISGNVETTPARQDRQNENKEFESDRPAKTYVIEVPVAIDGREIAHATAEYTDSELGEISDLRDRGVR